ncbi:MAG TPA: AI-2E family transporter [Candidatus Humimicrobiaceae bacterium]|nr:AI-2E family transporter [Candidatus Humimicrobiaceae bacterium]
MNNEKILDISWGTLLKIGVASLGFYMVYLVKDILIWLIFALIISVLLTPAIDFLQKRRVPRTAATIFVFIFVFGALGILIYLIAPVFITQIQGFAEHIPQYFEKFSPLLKELGLEASDSFDVFTQSFRAGLVQASESIISAIVSIFGGIFTTITIFILAIFISLEEKGMERAIRTLFPKKQEEEVLNIWKSCQLKVSGWFGARILACLFVGIMSYLALWLCDINYPFILALFAGVADIIPIIGPIIAGIVIALIAAFDSPWIAVVVLLVFIIIQQIEGNILTPLLTKRFIGLSPALVLIALMIGGKFWGILGAILAIPLAGIIFEFTRDYLKKRKEGEISSSSQPAPSGSRKKSIIW